jgi:glutathione S-transferase
LFHAHDVSYFSGKARPAFPQKSLWMREVLPDIRMIKRRTGVHYFPAVETPDGELWQDTSDILDRLESRHPDPPLFPTTPVQRIVAYLVELYGDEVGLLPAMHYRWSFEESVAKVSVDFSTPIGDPSGGAQFAERMAGSLPFLGVTKETIPAIEAHTRALLDALSDHFATHRYLLGDAMSLADCGLMGPLYGHLFRDAVPEKLLYETAFHVCAWVERMNRPPLDQTGWLQGDRLPETLLPVLRVMADGVPMLVGAVLAIDAWAAENASESAAVPGGVGLQQTSFRDVPCSPAVRSYTLWMVQRVLDAYAALSSADREAVDSALLGSGWEPLLALQPKHRLEKRAYQLAWAT